MKKGIILFLTAWCCTSCLKKEVVDNKQTPQKVEKETEVEKFSIKPEDHENLVEWMAYYQERENTFSLGRFEKDREKYSKHFMKGSVSGTFDDAFNPIYEPFLVYRKDRKQYIDLDSYAWELDENELDFDVDQEINWVDVEKKTVTRIGFTGPGFTIENAFWKNDSVAVLLGRGLFDEGPKLFINEINLVTQTGKLFISQDTLRFTNAFKLDYTEYRIQKKGLKYKTP